MSYHSVEDIATFEHFNLGFDARSWVRSVNHRFIEDTLVENISEPGLYISMFGKCQGQTLNDGMDRQRDYSHQYMVTLVDQPCSGHMHFPNNSIWQTLSIMLPLHGRDEQPLVPELRANFPHAVPQIRLAELGPVPRDILRCCEAVWECTFKGFERELFIKAKAQEVLALFLHKRRQQRQAPETLRMTQLGNVLNHIKTHLAQDWPLSAVASLAGSNRTYVKQDIKDLKGVSFREWLKQARLEAAYEQLAGGESITQIAHNVGFRSQAHFATLFKSEVGVTPSEYRQSLLIKHSA
ncbi:helix-turn-helix transcriptional regulator [Marinomonas transparens]|uniref:Helix-turn-helix transcriptional regulator n=1 Tax=Marinomonas transparens TaxID=2795388 RepID=A0A934JQ96_9GAMM|nr:AraC family transcriptional regulator [Marinomonas transparens]MBJ7538094.1 helix-turn-helix transcriptional regulator [Marinomonas transparens]